MTDEHIPEEADQPEAEPVEQNAEKATEQTAAAASADAVDSQPDSGNAPVGETAAVESSSLTGSIEALEPLEPGAMLGDEAVSAGASESADAAATTLLPVTEGLTDAEAAALAASTLPAAEPVGGPEQAGVPDVVDLGAPEGIDMGPDRPSRWWLWILIIVLVLAVGGVIGYAWWWSTNRPISVPDVVGKQASEATQIFNDVDLRLGDVSEAATDAAPVGAILSQNPEAGTRLKPGGRVSFVLASAPIQTKVPDINGRLSEDAETALAKARLRPLVVESFATTVAAGYVVSQLPNVGVELPPGAPVAVVVSKGPVPSAVSVPRLSGMLEADASRLVAATDLKPIVYRSFDPSITAGTVLNQAPASGVAAPYGSHVQILVSQGAGTATIVVPTVTGQSRASAVKELKGKGLKLESRVVPHPTIPRGQVVSQMPPAGRRAVSGSTVGVLVSRGNTAEANVPSLVGTSSAGVADAITSAGFVPVVVNVPVSQFTAGTVFMQFPGPGSALTRGLPVVCLIAAPVPTEPLSSGEASPGTGMLTTPPGTLPPSLTTTP